jgi:hypothetical protein
VLSALAHSQANIAHASSSTAAALDLARQTIRTAGPVRARGGQPAAPSAKKYALKKFVLVAVAMRRLQKIVEKKKLVIKQEQQDEIRVICLDFARAPRRSSGDARVAGSGGDVHGCGQVMVEETRSCVART